MSFGLTLDVSREASPTCSRDRRRAPANQDSVLFAGAPQNNRCTFDRTGGWVSQATGLPTTILSGVTRNPSPSEGSRHLYSNADCIRQLRRLQCGLPASVGREAFLGHDYHVSRPHV